MRFRMARPERAGWVWTKAPPDAVVITLPPYTEAGAELEGERRAVAAYAREDARHTMELYRGGGMANNQPQMRVVKATVFRLLARNGIRPQQVRTRRQGGHLRQVTPHIVRLSIDIDDEAERDSWARRARLALVRAGYDLDEWRHGTLIAYQITRKERHG